MNARFWVFVNGGPVKLTLKPGQSLSRSKWQRHEEGYSTEQETWTHDTDCVRREWSFGGCDCDGSLERYGKDFCWLSDLLVLEPYSADDPNYQGVRWPDWQEEDRGQRDLYAEMAGY